MSCAIDEEGVGYQMWLMWMMNDEEGDERKTKNLFFFCFDGQRAGD